MPQSATGRRDLTQHEIDFAVADECHRLVDAIGRGAELAAPVHEREVTRNRREVQRPIERGIAAARDHDALVAQRFHLPDGIENGGALIGLDARDRRPFGLERAASCRDHDDLDFEYLAAIGLHAEQRIADLLDRPHHLLKVKRRPERFDLRQQGVAETLPGDVGHARNVVDRLLRIELRALTADLVEDVDHVRLHVEQTKLEHREQPARSGADDQHVGLDRFAHAFSRRLACGCVLIWVMLRECVAAAARGR